MSRPIFVRMIYYSLLTLTGPVDLSLLEAISCCESDIQGACRAGTSACIDHR
jgi:hypothetical protein